LSDIIWAAIIAGGISVITLAVNEFFQFLRRTDERKERFFYELYSRKIASHERLLRIAAEYSSRFVPAGLLGNYRRGVNEFLKVFLGEIVASHLFADKNVLAAAKELYNIVGAEFDKLLNTGRLSGHEEELLVLDDRANGALEIRDAYNAFLKEAREQKSIAAMQAYEEKITKLRGKRGKKIKKNDRDLPDEHADDSA